MRQLVAQITPSEKQQQQITAIKRDKDQGNQADTDAKRKILGNL